jgi:hypothetical protein
MSMPSPQKNKGSGFEREIAKYLSDTYGESFIRARTVLMWVGKIKVEQKYYTKDRFVRSKDDIGPQIIY